MAAVFDVSARLAEGRGALDAAQAYVSASRLRGYAHPDLTRYFGQVQDWYCTLDGLDLAALGADCQTLRTAADGAGSALGDIRAAVAGLPAAWLGQGGTAATEFLAGHCDTAQRLVDALHVAQNCCSSLREELWHLVDRKVAATLAVAEQGRSEWRSAADAVIAGDPGRSDAGSIIDSQVTPFVDNVIRGEWLAAMRSVAAAVEDAYRAAIAQAGALGGLVFAVPGGMVAQYSAPAPQQSVRPSGVGIAALRETTAVPAGFTAMPGLPASPLDVPAAVPTATGFGAGSPAALPPAVRNALDSLGSGMLPAMPGFGAGLPGLGTGLPTPGFPASSPEFGPSGPDMLPHSTSRSMDLPELDPPQLGDTDQGAATDDELDATAPGQAEGGQPADGEAEDAEDADGADAEDADDPEDEDADDPEDADGADSAARPSESKPQSDGPEPAADAAGEPPSVPDCPQQTAPAAEPGEPAPAADPAPPAPPTQPAPPPSAPEQPEPAQPAEPKTPCEIAADELPQVGE